ncbi:protein translocase subunit SecDF [Haloferula sp. BvORR071]|uniref:protein translocase subunit SecDF n=1 Tax=Haloferula sp. BvORR071 TaxID=1396141 RepID=UPI00055513D2|nr:protein translocase subunit SecDF [Haloferula sp. BvORR071]
MYPPTLLAASLLKDPMLLFISGLALMVLFFWYFATDIEVRKRNVGTILTIGTCVLCTLAIIPPKETLKGGIDLVGGFSYTLQVQPKIDENTNKPIPLTSDDLKQARSIIEKRLNALGTSEMEVVETGSDKLLIQIPGIAAEDAEGVRTQLEKVAKLELRKVNLEGFTQGGPNNTILAERIKKGEAPRIPGYTAYEYKRKHDDIERTDYVLLSNRAALTGKDVQEAWPQQDAGKIFVSINLTTAGEDKMINLTKDMTPHRDCIAVLMDNEVLTAPVVNSVPLGKNFMIEGQQSVEEARSLANAMKNPLENPVRIINKREISPKLGATVIKQSLMAGGVGLLITALFVLIYYRTAGIVALVGLVINGLMVFGGMALFQFTFSLPGIAGMILTIGMAVDANVLIYERLREEMAAGKSLKVAISLSYEKAFSAIFDSNITSLITAVILFWVGSGTIKGFAVTLVIGLVSSMFSAILVTRVLFRWCNDLNLFKKLSFLDLIKSTNVDFLAKSKLSYIISGLMIAASIGAVAVRGERSLGVDFTGGTILTFQLDEKHLDAHEVEKSVEQVETAKLPSVQSEKSITGELLTIRCGEGDAPKIEEHLRKAFPVLAETKEVDGKQVPVVAASVDAVAASLGADFIRESLIALGLGLLGILVYITIRFEFSFALGGFVALLHDVVLSAGIVILLGSELSLIHVGALLTIAGYSINDTIVIFDRIRDSLKTGEGEVRELMNEAINATLSRTILTALTTIVTVALIAIFGSAALKDFAIMILIGLLIGTYSSIFIASPVVLWWSERKGGLRKEVMRTTLAESDITAMP